MLGTLFRGGKAARRREFVNTYAFPPSVVSRYRWSHPWLTDGDVAAVTASARQWFRLLQCESSTPLAMPSEAVDELWHEFVLHTRDYADFCAQAFGRFMHHVPDEAGTGAGRHRRLMVTYRAACVDETLPFGGLPMLFRVDVDVRHPRPMRYAYCGAEPCSAPAGWMCLAYHSAFRRRDDSDPVDGGCGGGDAASAGDGGGGCGGGCGS